jgi:hypothetical protein
VPKLSLVTRIKKKEFKINREDLFLKYQTACKAGRGSSQEKIKFKKQVFSRSRNCYSRRTSHPGPPGPLMQMKQCAPF